MEYGGMARYLAQENVCWNTARANKELKSVRTGCKQTSSAAHSSFKCVGRTATRSDLALKISQKWETDLLKNGLAALSLLLRRNCTALVCLYGCSPACTLFLQLGLGKGMVVKITRANIGGNALEINKR